MLKSYMLKYVITNNCSSRLYCHCYFCMHEKNVHNCKKTPTLGGKAQRPLYNHHGYKGIHLVKNFLMQKLVGESLKIVKGLIVTQGQTNQDVWRSVNKIHLPIPPEVNSSSTSHDPEQFQSALVPISTAPLPTWTSTYFLCWENHADRKGQSFLPIVVDPDLTTDLPTLANLDPKSPPNQETKHTQSTKTLLLTIKHMDSIK